jgi:hypothetical protein
MTQPLVGEHLSQLSLDLLLLGDLDERNLEAARAHLDVCSTCRELHDWSRSSAARFDQNVYAPTLPRVARALREHFPMPRPRRSPWWPTGFTITAMAVTALLLMLRPHATLIDTSSDLLQKGTPSLVVFGRNGGRVFSVSDGARLQPGDGLRFAADPAGFSYLLIASIDAANHATIYFPYQGDMSGRIDPNRRFESDFSIVLDDTRGPERIFALFSSEAVVADSVITALTDIGHRGNDAIRRDTRVAVSGHNLQISILIEK